MSLFNFVVGIFAVVVVMAPACYATSEVYQELPPGTLAMPLYRVVNQTAYAVKMKIGTPPQDMKVIIDTGSQYIGLQGTNSNWCTLAERPCEMYGSYDNLTSSTAIYKNETFFNTLINHGFGSYISDTVSVGGKTFERIIFGMIVDYQASFPALNPNCGLMGMVPYCGNSKCTKTFRTTLQQKLMYHGYLKSNVMSIYLGPEDEDAVGSLLYGAIDQAKQKGNVVTIPVVDPASPVANSAPNNIYYSSMALERKVKQAYGNQHVGEEQAAQLKTETYVIPQNATALLDTGNPGFSLPNKAYSAIKEYFNFPEHSSLSGGHKVDCKFRKQQSDDATLLVGFANDKLKIRIPLCRLVTQLAPGKCVTILEPSGNGKFLALGDPFLRSTYTVWDFDKLTISMSNVNYTTETDIVAA